MVTKRRERSIENVHVRISEVHNTLDRHLRQNPHGDAHIHADTQKSAAHHSRTERLFRCLNSYVGEAERLRRRLHHSNARSATEPDKKLLASVIACDAAGAKDLIDGKEAACPNALHDYRTHSDQTHAHMIFVALKELRRQRRKLDLETWNVLLKHKMSPVAKNPERTPLISVLIYYGYGLEFIKPLVEEAGSGILRETDASGVSPFMAACDSCKGAHGYDFSIVDYIHSADPGAAHLEDEDGFSAMDRQLFSNEVPVMKHLFSIGVVPDAKHLAFIRPHTTAARLAEPTLDALESEHARKHDNHEINDLFYIHVDDGTASAYAAMLIKARRRSGNAAPAR